jgi:sugar lactone lactonase YvrE
MRRPKVQPVVWQPPKLPWRSRPPRTTLPALTVLAVNGHGTEDVVVDDRGHVFTGVEDGRILRLTSDGRRLGIELYPDGRLLVCDARRGLLLVDRVNGELEVLIPRGPQLRVCNNAAVKSDGTIFFTDSSSRFDLEHYVADLIEHSGTGRLLRRDPDGTVTTVLSGLQFANGVALASDESYVVVAQTGSYRLDRVWLSGEKAGTSETLDGNLPAFPDNLSTGSDGLIWVAMASPRDRLLDQLHRRAPVARKVVWALPEALRPKEKKVVWVRAVDGLTGAVVHDLYGASESFHMVTGVREHGGTVYLGSLQERGIARFALG